MSGADRVTEATRVAVYEARTLGAQLATLTSDPWPADVRAKLYARLPQLEQLSGDLEEYAGRSCLTLHRAIHERTPAMEVPLLRWIRVARLTGLPSITTLAVPVKALPVVAATKTPRARLAT